ncbi:transposase [Streptomyces sp. NPDC056580]|uniref:transposase n=1 Tax=Streptomyces sp. NPDC056580 TaxID=3345872 RepID=UPI0036956DF8
MHIGDISRFPTEHHFASYTGSALLDASSGNNVRHRLNIGGNARSTRSCTPSPSARSATAGAGRTITSARSLRGRRLRRLVGPSTDGCPTWSTSTGS